MRSWASEHFRFLTGSCLPGDGFDKHEQVTSVGSVVSKQVCSLIQACSFFVHKGKQSLRLGILQSPTCKIKHFGCFVFWLLL